MSAREFTADSVQEYFGYASHWLSTRPGENIHYLDEGPRDGTAVVLVHGSALGITAAANFYLTIPALVDAGYRVLAPDLYGYGWTQAPADVAAVRRNHVDLVLRLLDAHGIERAYLVGNSLGGMVSAALAIDHPQRVLGNIIIGTGGARWPGGSRFEPNLSSRGDADPYTRAKVSNAMRHLVDDPAIIPPELVAYRVHMAELPGAYERHLESTRMREQTKKDYPFDVERARQCQVPTLIMYGREDKISPPEDALAAAEAFPHADMMLFGHCGHWTMIERADDFNALMLRFLSGYDRRIAQPPMPANPLRGDRLDDHV